MRIYLILIEILSPLTVFVRYGEDISIFGLIYIELLAPLCHLFVYMKTWWFLNPIFVLRIGYPGKDKAGDIV